MRKFERVLEGTYSYLKLNGQMSAVETLERATRVIRTELAKDKSVDVEAALRFVARLGSDPAAELAVE
jgi:hypothetical protein